MVSAQRSGTTFFLKPSKTQSIDSLLILCITLPSDLNSISLVGNTFLRLDCRTTSYRHASEIPQLETTAYRQSRLDYGGIELVCGHAVTLNYSYRDSHRPRRRIVKICQCVSPQLLLA